MRSSLSASRISSSSSSSLSRYQHHPIASSKAVLNNHSQSKKSIQISDSIYEHNVTPYSHAHYAASTRTTKSPANLKFTTTANSASSSISSLTPSKLNAQSRQHTTTTSNKRPFFFQNIPVNQNYQQLSNRSVEPIHTSLSICSHNRSLGIERKSTGLDTSYRQLSNISHNGEQQSSVSSGSTRALDCSNSMQIMTSRHRSNTYQTEDSERLIADRVLTQNNNLSNILKQQNMNHLRAKNQQMSQSSTQFSSAFLKNQRMNFPKTNGQKADLNQNQQLKIVESIIENIMNPREEPSLKTADQIGFLSTDEMMSDQQNSIGSQGESQATILTLKSENSTLIDQNRQLVDSQNALIKQLSSVKESMSKQVTSLLAELSSCSQFEGLYVQLKELSAKKEEEICELERQISVFKNAIVAVVFDAFEMDVIVQKFSEILRSTPTIIAASSISRIVEISQKKAEQMVQKLSPVVEILNISKQLEEFQEMIQSELADMCAGFANEVSIKPSTVHNTTSCQTSFIEDGSTLKTLQNGTLRNLIPIRIQKQHQQQQQQSSQQPGHSKNSSSLTKASVILPRTTLTIKCSSSIDVSCLYSQDNSVIQSEIEDKKTSPFYYDQTIVSDNISDKVFSSAPNPLDQFSQGTSEYYQTRDEYKGEMQLIDNNSQETKGNGSSVEQQKERSTTPMIASLKNSPFFQGLTSPAGLDSMHKIQRPSDQPPINVETNSSIANINNKSTATQEQRVVNRHQASTHSDMPRSDRSNTATARGNKSNTEVDVMNLSPCLSTSRVVDFEYSSFMNPLDIHDGVSNQRVLVQSKHLSKASISYQPPHNSSHLSLTSLSAFGLPCADISFDHEQNNNEVRGKQHSFDQEQNRSEPIANLMEQEPKNNSQCDSSQKQLEVNENSMAHESHTQATSSEQNSLQKKDQVQACYPFKAQKENDLEFEAGDVIQVLKRTPNGWWIGYCRSKMGYFPSNFVQPI